MNRHFKILTLTAGAAVIGSGLLLSNDLKADGHFADIVKERQDLMKTMGKSFGPLVAVLKGESNDLEAAAAAAQTMHDSMVDVGKLFPEGTANGEVPGSRAKPEVWTKAAEFKTASDALIEATANLVVAAKSGDINNFKTQFQPAGKACGGCHEGPAADGGKFRVPKGS